MSKIVAVIGATGTQGGSVVTRLLADGVYKVRGITRNVKSAKAQALAAQGVEVVKADLDDEQSLIKAFEGVSAIYAVTDFFEPFAKHGPEVALKHEVAQGINLANAASKTPSLEHYIWSTLPNGKELTKGKYVVPHFEGKNQIDAYIKKDFNLLSKTTFLWNSFYASNLMYPPFTPNLLKSSGKYIWLQPAPPSTPITMLGDTSANVGAFVSGILKRPDLTLPGRFVLVTVEEMAHRDILAMWGRITGKETEYVQCTLEEFNRLWPIWGQEMGLMMEMWGELGSKSWSGEKLVSNEALGITGLKNTESFFKAADWGV